MNYPHRFISAYSKKTFRDFRIITDRFIQVEEYFSISFERISTILPVFFLTSQAHLFFFFFTSQSQHPGSLVHQKEPNIFLLTTGPLSLRHFYIRTPLSALPLLFTPSPLLLDIFIWRMLDVWTMACQKRHSCCCTSTPPPLHNPFSEKGFSVVDSNRNSLSSHSKGCISGCENDAASIS